MIRWNTITVHACVASAIIAFPLLAQKQDKQAAANACSIKTDKPDEVKSALNALTVAQLGGRPEDQQKRLKTAVAALTQNPSKYKDNQAGHDYVLGQALVRWAQQFPDSTTVSKGTLGYTEGKDQSIDLLATADTLFSSVEKSNPDCAAEVSSFRLEAMRPFAIRASNLLNTDSAAQAEAVVNRLKVIDNKSPLSLYFQGMVAQNKKDVTSAADLFSRGAAAMPAAAGADSNLKAADLYRKYLADFPKSANATDAQAGLAAALSASGDAQSVGKLWDDMLATPANYTSAQLYDAGTQAFTANQYASAVKLMDAAQAKNGWLRPGLYNAANVYWKAGDFDRMLATAKKLTQIDPNNPDEYQLLALAYQGKSKATKDPKLVRAYNDSLNAAFAASEKVKVKVTFDAFAIGSAKPTLSGTLENLSDAPQKGTIKFTFLNESGAPVTTTTSDFTLAPKEKKPFSVTGEGAGIAAYKYDPLP